MNLDDAYGADHEESPGMAGSFSFAPCRLITELLQDCWPLRRTVLLYRSRRTRMGRSS